MSESLREDLKEELISISGVGEATAEAILDVLDDHDLGGESAGESAYLRRARDAAMDGEYREAAILLNRDTRADK